VHYAMDASLQQNSAESTVQRLGIKLVVSAFIAGAVLGLSLSHASSSFSSWTQTQEQALHARLSRQQPQDLPDFRNVSCPFSWCNSPYKFETVPQPVLAAMSVILGEEISSSATLTVTVHGPHGGLGDRIRGVYTCAMVALLTGRRLIVEPYILLKQEDPRGADAVVVDHDGDCSAPIFAQAYSKKQDARINTNCLFAKSHGGSFLHTLSTPLPAVQAQAYDALLQHCDGDFRMGDLTQTNCADYAGTGCFTVPKSYQCGPMLLHAAYAQRQPEMADLLWKVHDLHQQWKKTLAPQGYNTIHFRTGHSTLHLDEKVSLPSTLWPDAEWCGDRCTQWIQHGDEVAKSSTKQLTLPVTLSSDSSLLIGILQSHMWNSMRLLHCCAGAVHVARGGTISHEQDISIVQQNLFDLVTMGGSRRLFVDLGHFWNLGLFWWSNYTSTEVFIDRGPATTIPLLV